MNVLGDEVFDFNSKVAAVLGSFLLYTFSENTFSGSWSKSSFVLQLLIHARNGKTVHIVLELKLFVVSCVFLSEYFYSNHKSVVLLNF